MGAELYLFSEEIKKEKSFDSIDYIQASIKHKKKYLGENVTIAILDTGISSLHHLFKKKKLAVVIFWIKKIMKTMKI